MAKGKLKKGLLITLTVLVVTVAAVIACISPIAKYLVEKNSVKYLGRQIKIGWLYLNPFTGYLHIGNLKVYEPNSDSLFLTARGLSAKYEIFKMLHKTYEISSITLDEPVGYIIQNREVLNFSDLIPRFRHKGIRDTSIHNPPVHFNILDIKVTDGEFHYIAPRIPINYFVKHVNISSTGKWWNVDSMIIKFALQSGTGSGDIKGNGSITFDSVRYCMNTTISKFDLNILEQYLHDLANYGHLSALLDAHLIASGSFKNGLDMEATGHVAVNNFHFGKSAGDDFASFDNLTIEAEKISPKNFTYYFDSISILHPFFKYERYDYLNNLERMFGKGGSKIAEANEATKEGKFNLLIEIAKYLKKLGANFLKSYYKIDRLALYNGDVKFNDYSLREKFSAEASPLYISADSIDRSKQRFELVLATALRPYGKIGIDLSLDPDDFGNFDVKYKILKVPVSMFNPYVVSYTSFPLNRGTLEFNGKMEVEDSVIRSENHLLIIDPRIGRRLRKKDTRWIPVPLIMSLIRSSGNAIDFQIPIEGNLNNPHFKFWGIIEKVVENIFIKPPSMPYLIHVKEIEEDVEKSLTLTWLMRQITLTRQQETFITRLADFIQSNPQAVVNITSIIYADKEKENILLFEAKKKYFLQTHNIKIHDFIKDDSLFVDKMSVKDSMFIHYLDKHADSMMFTLQQKCGNVISKETVNNKYNQLMRDRERDFKNYFGNTAPRIKFRQVENVVPFNGLSYYKIEYNSEIPKTLLKAYDEMQQLNASPPRKKYKEERKALPG